jgi:cell division protein FtsW (lipid II flippase)
MTNFSIPFLSYTGSGTLVTYIMTGLVLSIYRNKSIVRDPKPIRIVRRRQYISAD